AHGNVLALAGAELHIEVEDVDGVPGGAQTDRAEPAFAAAADRVAIDAEADRAGAERFPSPGGRPAVPRPSRDEAIDGDVGAAAEGGDGVVDHHDLANRAGLATEVQRA